MKLVYRLLTLCLIIISYSCEESESITQETNAYETLSINTSEELQDLRNQFNSEVSGRIENSDNLLNNADWNKVLKVHDDVYGYDAYSINIVNNDITDNLLIFDMSDSIYSYRLLYNESLKEFGLYPLEENTIESGRIETGGVCYLDGIDWYYYPTEVSVEGEDVVISSLPAIQIYIYECGTTGGGWPIGNPDNPGSGSGRNPKMPIVETLCTPAIEELTGEEGDCVSEADAWEQDICQKINFQNNDCIQEIWNKMKDENVGYETLTNFLGNSPKAELCLDIKDLGSGVNGNTDPRVPGEITINLNSQTLNRSQLSIARTLLHEMIHAELFSYVIEAGGYDNFQEYAQNYNDEFLALWDYIDTYEDWQHEYMADSYITFIADGLQQLESYFISSSFRNAANNGYYFDVLGEDWNWDDFYNYVAWEGLHKTDQFQTDIVNRGLESKYEEYRSRLESDNDVNLDCQ